MRISDWSSDVCSSDLFFRFSRRSTKRNVAVDPAGWPRRPARPDRRSDPQSSRLRPLAGEQSLPGGRPCAGGANPGAVESRQVRGWHESARLDVRSEEHTSELQSLMRISYAVFCLTKHKTQ